MSEFARRLLMSAVYKPSKPKDRRWIERSEQERKGKYRYGGGSELPEGTFTKSPGQIVQTLKTHSKDFRQALARLNSFINTSGKNLDSADKSRLEQAKQGLYRAYGEKLPEKK